MKAKGSKLRRLVGRIALASIALILVLALAVIIYVQNQQSPSPAGVTESAAPRLSDDLPITATTQLVLHPATGLLARTDRPGKEKQVWFQARSGQDWRDLDTATFDASGEARLAMTLDEGATYRAVVSSGSDELVATEPLATAQAWRTDFSDDFNGTELDPTKWSIRYADQYFGARNCAAPQQAMSAVADGNWIGTVATSDTTISGCPYGVFQNASVGTAGKFSFKYGVLVARVKFPKMAGQHGGVWLQTTCLTQPCKHVETDMVEYFGVAHNPATGEEIQTSTASFVHLQNKRQAGGYTNLIQPKGSDYYETFHQFAVEWTPAGYTFWVDGKVTLKTTKISGNNPSYIVMTLVTSDWEIPKLDKANLPNSINVDWVRVYTRR